MEPKEVAPDSEMGRRPICRCLFAALGSIREVDHLTHRILASKMEQMPFVGAVYGKMTRSSGMKCTARSLTNMLRPNTQQSAIRHDGARSAGPKKYTLLRTSIPCTHQAEKSLHFLFGSNIDKVNGSVLWVMKHTF